MSLVTELRRRQVFRAAAWYAAAAWVAIQVASTIVPQFGLPDWSVRAVIVAAVFGLPVALALAWLFDLSALGLRREVTAPRDPSDGSAVAAPALAAPLWRIPSFWIALALGAVLAASAQQAWQRLIRPAFGERPGLAVLPFANLSPDPENAYFADGLHEEILATLARAGGLRVISRTSVQAYRDTQPQSARDRRRPGRDPDSRGLGASRRRRSAAHAAAHRRPDRRASLGGDLRQEVRGRLAAAAHRRRTGRGGDRRQAHARRAAADRAGADVESRSVRALPAGARPVRPAGFRGDGAAQRRATAQRGDRSGSEVRGGLCASGQGACPDPAQRLGLAGSRRASAGRHRAGADACTPSCRKPW